MTTARPAVFWSWQSDYSPKTCRTFVRDALSDAIAQLTTELDLEDAERPELDHDTKGERGMVDIATTILNKIAASAVFVADLTPIAKSDTGKWLPNPNVMIELGWALHRPGYEHVVGVLNVARGAKVEDLPFDIRQRRVITYELAETADKTQKAQVRSTLVGELKAALRVNLEERKEELASEVAIERVATKPDDPSIWASAEPTLTHNDAFNGPLRQRVALPTVPRAYMRVIPAGWRNGVPSVVDIAQLNRPLEVEAPRGGGSDGDWGATEAGFVRYWFIEDQSDGQRSAVNVAMWFEETGEFWILHGSVVRGLGARLFLAGDEVLASWSRSLRQTMTVLDHLNAHKMRRVEVGLFNVSEVRLPSRAQTLARKNAMKEERQSADWSTEVQLAFLTRAYNRVGDLFSLGRATQADIEAELRRLDPERF